MFKFNQIAYCSCFSIVVGEQGFKERWIGLCLERRKGCLFHFILIKRMNFNQMSLMICGLLCWSSIGIEEGGGGGGGAGLVEVSSKLPFLVIPVSTPSAASFNLI